MYEDETYEVILDRMLARVSDKFDKREGAVIWDTHSPTAIELQTLYIELDTILQNAYASTAGREFLILRCQERGIVPYAATAAVLQGEFTPEDVDVTGQRFTLEDLTYIVGDMISPGIYQVICETAGAVGNQYLGTLIPIDYIEGLETAQLTAVLIPGEDEEDTESLRARYMDSFTMQSFGGNVADYLKEVNSIAGVGATKVTRVWNGDISPADMIPTDEVTEWYESVIGTLSGDAEKWLTTVYTAAAEKKLTVGGTVLITIVDSTFSPASETLVATVQETLDPVDSAGEGSGLAPIGHVVTVRSAVGVEIDVTCHATFDSGYSLAGLQGQIDDAVDDYLLELRQSWAGVDEITVRAAQITSRILNIEGVLDVDSVTINGLAADVNLTLGAYEIPMFGGVVVDT